MIAAGSKVVVLPPFGDGVTQRLVVKVQQLNAGGQVIGEPILEQLPPEGGWAEGEEPEPVYPEDTVVVAEQYVLSDECAYSAQLLEEVAL